MVLEVTPCSPASNRKVVIPIASTANEAISRNSTFAESIQQKLPYPSNGVVCVAKDARLVVVRRAMGVSIWRIRGDEPGVLPEEAQGYDRVLDMDLNMATHLVTLAVSDDGHWLAVSDATEMKLFSLGDLVSRKSNALSGMSLTLSSRWAQKKLGQRESKTRHRFY